MITIRVILLSVFLVVIFAASSTYLALKVGILPSASIPATLLAVALLRLFKNTNIFEINLIQTSASSGEAVAGGIAFTIPALVMIHYWDHFPYLENVAIALLGGLLGILFSIPLRRILMKAPQLYFPEARAITEVLQLVKNQTFHITKMLLGTSLGALLEFTQTGLKIVAVAIEKWVVIGHFGLFGFGLGFSPALLGVGYLIGFPVGCSLLLGAFVAWGIGLPLLSHFIGLPGLLDLTAGVDLYRTDTHYMGLGAMLIAGLWTLLGLLKPFYQGLRLSLQGLGKGFFINTSRIASRDQDLPGIYLWVGLCTLVGGTYLLFDHLFPLQALLLNFPSLFIVGCVFYVLIIGFIFSAICGYFSGLVGVTASPGSAIVIAGFLLIAMILRMLFVFHGEKLLSTQLVSMAAITIITGAIVAGAACIANDNIQDLKVGYLIGAAPWRQQLMLILGVIISALVIPYVMQLLFNVYGFAAILPHSGMDSAHTLPAPSATMVAGLAQSVFSYELPWPMLAIGGATMGVLILLNTLGFIRVSLLGVAMGIYLPLSTSTALFVGSLLAFFIRHNLQRESKKQEENKKIKSQVHHAVLLACGLVAGSSLIDVLLAIPMSITGNPMLFAIMPSHWQWLKDILGLLSVLILGFSFYWVALLRKNS